MPRSLPIGEAVRLAGGHLQQTLANEEIYSALYIG